MLRKRVKLPSPAMTVALIALFVALAGTATAGVVTFAKRAGTANNARKLQGKNSAQVAAMPGPAASVTGLISVRTSSIVVPAAGFATGSVSCGDAGRVVAGGFSQVGGATIPGQTFPASDSTWQTFFNNVLGVEASNITMYAVCVK